MKNISFLGGQFASARGGQFAPARGGQFKSAGGGQFDWFLHTVQQAHNTSKFQSWLLKQSKLNCKQPTSFFE
jgi:hypothetical protein